MSISYGNGHYLRDDSGTWRYALTGNPVPGARDLWKAGKAVGLFAPELLPHRLLTLVQAAKAAGRTCGTWDNAVRRGFAPKPAGKLGIAPYWTEGIIREWLLAVERERIRRRQASYVKGSAGCAFRGAPGV